MSISVNSEERAYSPRTQYEAAKAAEMKKQTEETSKKTVKTDELSGTDSYEHTGTDAADVKNKAQAYDRQAVIDKLHESMQQAHQRLADMVAKVIGNQGKAGMFAKAGTLDFESQAFQDFKAGVLSGSITVDASTRMTAQDMISDGGIFSVEAVTDRTMAMVQALSGGDVSKLETLKNAVIKGFKEAERIWGGTMPEITQKTYDATMARFDQWEKTGKVPTSAADMQTAAAEE